MPTYLYRSYDNEAHARAFVEHGSIRFCLQRYYRDIEELCRQDVSEGRSLSYISIPESGKHGEYEGEHVNPIYLLCTAGPKVDLTYLREKYGKYVVRINDPYRLQEDISNATPVRTTMELSGRCNLEPVSYTKAEVTTLDLNKDLLASSKLIYTQKPRIYHDDYEYRFVLIATPPLHGAADNFLTFELGRPIPYTELL